jgi:hypothetical protein
MSTPSLSRRAFALQVGVDEKVIRRLIARGELPVDADGRLPMPAALQAYVQRRAIKAPAPAGSPPAAPGGPSGPIAPVAPIIELDMERKRQANRLQALKIGREEGKLLDRDTVAAEASAVLGAVRASLLVLPDRLALQLEAAVAAEPGPLRATKIRTLIAGEVDLVLQALYQGRHAGGGDAA